MAHNAEKLKENAKSVWGATPAGSVYGKNFERGSREFFEAILEKRFSYETPWMDEIVHFKQFAGKKVLEIGCGAGYDAYQFCRAGSEYTGIDITPENPPLAQRHLEHYGYKPRLLEMDAEKMTFQNEFDFVFSFGVLHHTPAIEKALANAHRALKAGGKIQVIVYHKWSIFYCVTLILRYWILNGNFLRHSLAYQRSLIEYSTSKARPLVHVYSKSDLKKKLEAAGFLIENTHIRKLLVEDLPFIYGMSKVYRYIPEKFLHLLSRRFGWYLSIIARKK